MTIEQYLIMVGIRAAEFSYSDEELMGNIEYFKKCHNQLSAYKALTFLDLYIQGDYEI